MLAAMFKQAPEGFRRTGGRQYAANLRAYLLLLVGIKIGHCRSRFSAFRSWSNHGTGGRSEEHTSELQSLMRISYAVFCLKKKKHTTNNRTSINVHEVNI